MQTMTLAEFRAALDAQGVARREDLAFKCPMCGTIQSAADILAATANTDFSKIEKYIGFSCVGRFTGAPPFKEGAASGAGGDWTLGGLFQLHKLEVVTEDGKRQPFFELATAEEAQAHARRAPHDEVT